MLASIMHKRISKFIIPMLLIGMVLFFVFVPELASAQTQDFGVSQFEQNTDLGNVDIRVIIARIIRAFLGLLGIIAVSIMVYAGYVWMTSGGNEEIIGFAKKTLINATIGLAIILSAFAIVQFVLNALADATRYDPDFDGGKPPDFDSFAGSGALGHVIQDHYPFRDQENVARNTKR